MKKFLHKYLSLALILAISFSPLANAGKTGTWSGSTTHQFFPTITNALLGNGYALVPTQSLFGDCSDGDVTISSGTTTLTRDMYYNNLTISGTGSISLQNQRIFICGTLDLSNAPAGAIDDSGGVAAAAAGNGGNSGAAGGNGNAVAAGTNAASKAGGNGGAGGTGAGSQGAVGSGGNDIGCVSGSTGSGGSSGAGGLGPSGAGGATRPQLVCTPYPLRDILHWYPPLTGTGAAIFSNGSGPGGGGGGGDGTNSGGGGGGGGASGATARIAAFILKTNGSTAAGAIRVNGGNGGNGGSPTVGNTGGGGAGAGGAGGWLVFLYNTKVGAAVTNLLQALGGSNGTAGTGHGTGASGTVGATTPLPGLIQVLNLATGAYTTSLTGTVTL